MKGYVLKTIIGLTGVAIAMLGVFIHKWEMVAAGFLIIIISFTISDEKEL